MDCPYCKASTKVTNSRQRAKGTQVWRRRQCASCSAIWTTYEVIDLSKSHKVQDENSNVEPFSREILLQSIQDSLRHRKAALEDAIHLTDTVVTKALSLKNATIDVAALQKLTYDVLRRYDKTAAAVYKASHTR